MVWCCTLVHIFRLVQRCCLWGRIQSLLYAAGHRQSLLLLGCVQWPQPPSTGLCQPLLLNLTIPQALPADMATRATRGLYLRREVTAARSCAAGQSLSSPLRPRSQSLMASL